MSNFLHQNKTKTTAELSIFKVQLKNQQSWLPKPFKNASSAKRQEMKDISHFPKIQNSKNAGYKNALNSHQTKMKQKLLIQKESVIGILLPRKSKLHHVDINLFQVNCENENQA